MRNQKIILFDNYHEELRDYNEIRAFLLEEYGEDEITDQMVYEEMSKQDDVNWQEIHEELRHFFNGENWLAMGAVGRWDGRYVAGDVFDNFDDLFYKVTKDCDYWRIWDEGGHFHLKCSHHDGTNHFEIKRITQRARDYIDNWTSDKTDAEKHAAVFRATSFPLCPDSPRRHGGAEIEKEGCLMCLVVIGGRVAMECTKDYSGAFYHYGAYYTYIF